MVHLTQTESRMRRQRNKRVRDRPMRNYILLLRWVIFGFLDGNYIEPESRQLFLPSTRNVCLFVCFVCLNIFFFCLLAASFSNWKKLFLKMPFHKRSERRRNSFLFRRYQFTELLLCSAIKMRSAERWVKLYFLRDFDVIALNFWETSLSVKCLVISKQQP